MGFTESCLGLFDTEEVSQLGCMDSGNKLPRLKKGPGRQVQGVRLGQAVSLVVSLLGTFRAQETEKQRYVPQERREERCRHVPEQDSV